MRSPATPLLALLLALLLAQLPSSHAQAAPGPCEQIAASCQAAGLAAPDCVAAILAGRAPPAKAGRRLSRIEPALVQACRAAAATAAAAALTEPEAPLPPRPGRWPNIVMILTDDFSLNLVQHEMPNLWALQRDGMSFTNAFVTDSLCCPSRSSILTGKLPHNTQVFTNTPPLGGNQAFAAHGNPAHSFAVALRQAGYRTAMMGKYLNGYEPDRDGVPPGWTEWDVAGIAGYYEFNYTLNRNGRLQRYGRDPASYMTDVLSDLGDAFIRQSAGSPFFLEIATFAPHAPYVPAPADADKFHGLVYDRTPAFAARPGPGAPGWLTKIPPLGREEIAAIDRYFRLRVLCDQAVDRLIGRMRATLASLGLDRDTYVIFTSDNGLHMGEYSLRPGKMTPFDIDTHVPLVVAGPGVPRARLSDAIVENIDLAPTFTELAGEAGPTEPDGRSLLPLLHPADGPPIAWRQMALIEHRHPTPTPADPDIQEPLSGDPPSYEALRLRDGLYVEYDDRTHEIGYYDLVRDPEARVNIAYTLSAERRARLHAALLANEACRGAASCWAAQSAVP
jgi:arylsulfatase A-like enzyme